jgi:hypothetical protein
MLGSSGIAEGRVASEETAISELIVRSDSEM